MVRRRGLKSRGTEGVAAADAGEGSAVKRHLLAAALARYSDNCYDVQTGKTVKEACSVSALYVWSRELLHYLPHMLAATNSGCVLLLQERPAGRHPG